jgi:hypothetical protein
VIEFIPFLPHGISMKRKVSGAKRMKDKEIIDTKKFTEVSGQLWWGVGLLSSEAGRLLEPWDN